VWWDRKSITDVAMSALIEVKGRFKGVLSDVLLQSNGLVPFLIVNSTNSRQQQLHSSPSKPFLVLLSHHHHHHLRSSFFSVLAMDSIPVLHHVLCDLV
jgi:hypothetical protein